MGVEKPGFFDDLGVDGKILAETRFLVISREGGLRMGVEKPGFFDDLGVDAKILAETRFLGHLA